MPAPDDPRGAGPRCGLRVVEMAGIDPAPFAAMLHGMLAAGTWRDERGVNLLDTGRPWYDVYATADGRWMSVGPLKGRFYGEFATRLGLPADLVRPPARRGAHTREVLTDRGVAGVEDLLDGGAAVQAGGSTWTGDEEAA